MAKGNRVGIKGSNRRIQQSDHDSEESDEEYKVTEDEELDESDEHYSIDGDESDEILADFEVSKRVSRSRNTRRNSSGGNKIMPRKRRRVLYTEDEDEDEDEDLEEVDEEFKSFERKTDPIKKRREKKRVSYTELDDDVGVEEEDEEFKSFERKTNQIKKPREKKRVSHTELDDDDEEEDLEEIVSSGRKRNHRKKRVLYTDDDGDEDEDDDDDEFMYSGKKANQKKRLREKRKISYTEDDDEEEEDFELISSSKKENQINEPREKKTISYKEDNEEEEEEDEKDAAFTLSESDFVVDEDDSEFIPSNRKENEIKESREKKTVSYKEDNEEDEDEKDAEFILSESDFVDDEEESPRIKKNEKVSRYHPQKKNIKGGRKNVKKSKTKKSTRTKQRNHRSGQKSSSSKEKAVVEKRNTKISKRRKHRVTAQSDSDFVSSASSDHDYTISEEEREQMREARVYCANLRAKLRGKQEKEKEEEETVHGQRKYPLRKGKEKVEDTKEELGKQTCGICLSEEGKRTVRGVLNCCRHYFCFHCIMEWSKVESRCPLCKQRFATITKAAKSDTMFDFRTVVIPVPECDQVYQPSEEELRGYLDPYESVMCTECQNGGDDALMLLCDICDSSAHTFCVGLGREVPEGNWYCNGCRPTVFSSMNSQRPTPNSDRRLSSNASDLSSPITGGFDLNEMYVPETPLTQQTRVLPEPAPAGTVATTLRDRRRIHRQIHHRFLNNNRMSDFVGRSSGTSASSSGIRLFGSQLDQARDSTPLQSPTPQRLEDQINTNLFSTRSDLLEDDHGGSSMAFDSRLGYAQLHPCTNRSNIGSDANPSPYACREVVGPSRTTQGGLQAPY